MNILEQIFKLENPKLEYKISEDVYDLLFDWFNAANINVSTFENELFEPIIAAIRTLEHENKYFEINYEQVRRHYYLQFAFIYLISHFPDNTFLKRLFELENSILNDITRGYNHASLEQNYPDLFRPIIIGSQIAKYYHAIHTRKDANISYLPCNFAQLKFQEDAVCFSEIFEYVNRQTFEEKPYLLFLLFKSTTQQYNYEKDEQGNRISREVLTISTSPYDHLINKVFEDSIAVYNELHNAKLNKDIFLILQDFLSYEEIDKKTKLTLSNFDQAKRVINAVKGNEILFLDHVIYFLKHEYLYEKDRYWKIMLAEVCKNLLCPQDWLENKIDFLLVKNKIHNSHLIFNEIITPLLENISSSLLYNNPVVLKYESLLFKRTAGNPYPKGLSVLRTIAETIENQQERSFVLSKLGRFYFQTHLINSSYLNYDDKDKSYPVIKNFIEELNVLVPVALKKVNKQTYYEDEDQKMFVINHVGKDIGIARYNFLTDINALLDNVNSPYRLVSIPLIAKEQDRNKQCFTVFSYTFMNQKEYEYYKQFYFSSENIQKFFPQNEEWFKSNMEYILFLNINFTTYTDLSFEEYKLTQQNNGAKPETSNLFLADINWGWFKDKYIDELSSREQWYEIMNVICQCPKGRKPTSSWITVLKTEIEKLGTEKYFKELQVLFSLSLKEESWFFGDYANALKGLIWSCAYINPNDLSLSILKTIIEHSYAKIPGVGAKSTITGNLALEALVATQKEEAFGILNIMRNKTKYNKFVVALEKSIDKFKENSTIPEQLLADKSIPIFGFENGEKTFQIADHKLIISFKNKAIIKQWFYKDGTALKQIPPDIKNDYAKELKEITEEIKLITTIFNDLKKRIKTYWLYNRIWDFADWKKYIQNHNLIYPHAEGLIWTNTTQDIDFILLNNQLLTIDNKPFTANENDQICLWHPVSNTEENISQWQNYLWTNKINQSERQAFRESYPFSTTELTLSETPRFAHHFLEINKLMGIANNAGWIFTYVHEGVNWPRVYIKPLNITAHILCDYDRYSYAIPTKELYFTNENSTKINDYDLKKDIEKITLAQIPLVTLSEICRDIDLFIATTSIANNVELSENRQEFENYRTDYRKGLFSENANGKIRKQIIQKLSSELKLQIHQFDGNFVIINGKTEQYKINLNSGFAQTNETQKHINLLPDIKKLKSDKKLRLPIEDDETLYIILAKILYLQNL